MYVRGPGREGKGEQGLGEAGAMGRIQREEPSQWRYKPFLLTSVGNMGLRTLKVSSGMPPRDQLDPSLAAQMLVWKLSPREGQ